MHIRLLAITALSFVVAATAAFSQPERDPHTAVVWLDKCARCHGDTGAGDTPLGRKLKVVNYRSREAQAKFTDEYLKKLIDEGKIVAGKTVMPGYGQDLEGSDIANLVSYVRALAQ